MVDLDPLVNQEFKIHLWEDRIVDYKIVTDSTADLPRNFYAENDIGCMFVPYFLNGITYSEETQLESKEFYRLMREEKAMPTTSQINPQQAKEYFEKWILENKNILCLSFSSGLSGLYNSVKMAAELIMEEHPEVHIIVIDSLCAELGEGLFVYTAVKLREQGHSMEDAAKWLQMHINNYAHVITADNLFHLCRGGRVSKTAAVVGTMMSIKPILHVDEEGHLIPILKARGRIKSLNTLVDIMEEKLKGYEAPFDMVMIGHSDCYDDALYVQEEVKKRLGRTKFIINNIGPTIGAHIGPDALTLFFMGKER